MKYLLKYLAPFTIGLLFSIGLLYVQAQMDLELPRYLSEIVNVGIMSDGIEHASPYVLTEPGMAFVQAMLPDDQDALVLEHYTLQESGDTIRVRGIVLTEYPAIYVLNEDIPATTLATLDETFGQVVWTVINVMQQLSGGNGGIGGTFDASNIDIEALYGLPTALALNPNGALVLSNAQTAAAAVDPQLKTQTGIVFVSGVYYAELGIDSQALQMNYILLTGLVMLGLTLIGMAAAIAVGFISAQIGAGVAKAMRRDVFAKVESFSAQEFNSFATSSLITRTTNDVNQVQQLVVIAIRLIFYAPIIAVGGILKIFTTNASMTWIIGVAVVALLALIVGVFAVALPKFTAVQKLIDRLNLVAREGLTGLMVIRAFGNQSFEEKRFDGANTDLTKTTLFVNRVIITMMPAMMFIMNVTVLAIVWFGAREISESNLKIGDMLAFMNYSMQVIMAFLLISMLFIFVPRAWVSLTRITEVLATLPKIVDPKNPKRLPKEVRGLVSFENVSFRFGNASEDVLSNITFKAEPGKTTAIIGSTGSGKSTLINLVPRFYDVTAGRITLDGIDIRELPQETLRANISYVPQRGMILSGTVESNLKYGRPNATQADIEEAASIAQATEFIQEKPDGYQSAIAQGGGNVSGGQKQRLSIARALVKKAPVVIFDDSFSALDFSTDQKLRQAMSKKVKGATLIIVAQRVGTIMNADNIIVLDNGRIIGQGKHKELLKTCQVYYEIASSQLAKEELARE